MNNILEKITQLRLERNWTEYELAQHSDVPQSTISSWYRKNQVPTVQTLEKICQGFGITLSQFFSVGNEAFYITAEQKEMLDNWATLVDEQKKLVMELIRNM